MFCEKCGKELDNKSRFCPYCGTVVDANEPQLAPAADSTYTPSGNTGDSGFDPNPRRARPGKWGKILIGAAAAALVVALVIGLFIIGVFSGDKGRLEKAVIKSISAYAGAARDASLPDLNDLIESQKFSQSGEIALENINLGWYGIFFDVSALEGTGIRFSTNYDLSGEKLSVSATPFYGSADLLTAELVMDGSRVYVSSPELTGTVYYGLDTMTLGRDLQKLGAGEDVVGGLSFNIFQLVKDMREITETDSENRKAIEDAGKALYKAIEVRKTGTETIKVNSGSVKCDAYTVTIPGDAIKDCLRAVKNEDYGKDLTALFSSMGLPDGMMDRIKDTLAGLGQPVKNMINSLEDMGDVELQVYVSNGYIMSVTYLGRIEGTRVKLELYLGGGKNYADDLSLTVSINDYAETEITLTSHGDHSAKSGTFTDKTVLEITQYGNAIEVSSEISFAPGKSQNNFSWRIDLGAIIINMEGQMTTGRNAMELHLEELELRAGDMSVTLRVDYSIGSYQGIPSVKSPEMISALDEDKLLEIVDGIRDNVADWAYGFLDEIPELNFIF